jgi:hypothetical protein
MPVYPWRQSFHSKMPRSKTWDVSMAGKIAGMRTSERGSQCAQHGTIGAGGLLILQPIHIHPLELAHSAALEYMVVAILRSRMAGFARLVLMPLLNGIEHAMSGPWNLASVGADRSECAFEEEKKKALLSI